MSEHDLKVGETYYVAYPDMMYVAQYDGHDAIGVPPDTEPAFEFLSDFTDSSKDDDGIIRLDIYDVHNHVFEECKSAAQAFREWNRRASDEQT